MFARKIYTQIPHSVIRRFSENGNTKIFHPIVEAVGIPVATAVGAIPIAQVIRETTSHITEQIAEETLSALGGLGLATAVIAGGAYLYATTPSKLDTDTLQAYNAALEGDTLDFQKNNAVTKLVRAGGTIPALQPNDSYATRLFHQYLHVEQNKSTTLQK